MPERSALLVSNTTPLIALAAATGSLDVLKGYCQLELPTTAARENPDMIKPSVVEPISYAGYRFPPEVIGCAVWLYFRFPLSLRVVEEMLGARSIDKCPSLS